MLRLAKIELNGFKSFATPTHLTFDGGISAVVGPNGCGKSNLCDAVAWVLGEQSAKSLRGEKMEDVIFNGSAKRHPLGMAEVELTLADDTGAFSDTGGTVTIGRRVFRSGESEYNLNGRRVRLKDVQDMLFDTGLGIRAYSIIEQGKISMILSTKPQDRRKLIEEAAGISKYKVKKRAAEMKLEEAALNLARVEDIILEVTHTMNSLKRQASRARRYQEVALELGGFKRRLYRARFLDRSAALAQTRRTLDDTKLEEAEALAVNTGGKLALETARGGVERVFAQLAAGREESMALRGLIERGEEALKNCARGAVEAGERQRLIAEMELRFRGDLETLEVSIRERQEALSDRERGIAARRFELAELQSAYRQALEEERREGTSRESFRERLLETIARLAENRNLEHQATLGIEKVDYALRKIAQDEARNAEKDTAVSRELSEVGAEAAATAIRVETAAARVGELEAERRQIESDLANTRRQLDGTRHDCIATRLERDSLLEAERAQRNEAGGLEVALAAQENVERKVGSDYLEARGNYEAVLDFYLRDLLHGVVVDSSATAARLLSEVKAQEGGRTTFVSRQWEGSLSGRREGAGLGSPRPDEARILTSVRESVSFAPDAASWMVAAIPEAFVVADLGTATELASRYPDTPFLTLDLDLVVNNRVSGGAAPPRGIFTLRRDLKAANERLLELTAHETGLENQLGAFEESLRRSLDSLAAELDRRSREERAFGILAARRQALAAETERLARERAVYAGEREVEAEERERLTQRRATLGIALGNLEAIETDLGRQLNDSAQTLERAHERTAELQSSAANLSTVAEVEQEKLSAALAELENARANHAALGVRLEELRREDEALGERQRNLAAEEERERAELGRSLATFDRKRDEIAVLEDRHARGREALAPAERSVAVAEAKLEEIRQRLMGLEIDAARLDSDLKHLRAAYETDLQEKFPAAAGDAGEEDAREKEDEAGVIPEAAELDGAEIASPGYALAMASGIGSRSPIQESEGTISTSPRRGQWPAEPETLPLDELETTVARLARKLESLGPVNLLAIEEFREYETRHTFLTTQRTDLVASIESLRDTIKKINKTSTELFIAAFAAINQNFDQFFRQLFRGGAASMRLLDEDDPLESGIEVMAQPPGKKSQNILLLSGGEKALTAIALLFGIFQYKPSPFCILDEVDAPLDESNIERFTQILHQMVPETQFILITHNRRTMEIADVLYGVTMEEAGCSKLVSVRWNEQRLAVHG